MSPAETPTETGEIPESPRAPQIDELTRKIGSGASWFYWIAGLSIVNSLVFVIGGDGAFVVGLGISQVFDAVAAVAAEEVTGTPALLIRAGALFAGVLCAAGIALFGRFAHRRSGTAFVVGMGVYALDGALFLLAGDWMSVGFHAFALFSIAGGYTALRELRTLETSPESPAPRALAA